MNDFDKESRQNEREETNFIETTLENIANVRIEYKGRGMQVATLKKISIPTRRLDVVGDCTIYAEVGTTGGPDDDDSQCLTYLRVQDLGGTQIRKFTLWEDSLEIIFDGEDELNVLIALFHSLAFCLEKTAEDVKKDGCDEYDWLTYKNKIN